MEGLFDTARIYYNTCSSDVKRLAREFFNSLDSDGDGEVQLFEFLAFMNEQGLVKMKNPSFFQALDRDRNGTLGFYEVMALYYIIKSGRPVCEGCGDFIPGMFFTCSACFDNHSSSFCVCPECFRNNTFRHQHSQFLDNYALLEAKRKEALSSRRARQAQPSNTIARSNAQAPSNQLVRYNARAPSNTIARSNAQAPSNTIARSNAQAPSNQLVRYNARAEKRNAAMKALQIAISVGAIVSKLCNIM